MKRLICLALAALGALTLAACGLKGDLATPGPLWGDPNRAIVERELPSQQGEETQLIFTRDDVDLFQDDEEDEDPFAEPDAPASETD